MPRWTVDEAATKAELIPKPGAPSGLPEGGGGLIVYVDEHGNRRRLPADMSELSDEERDAALDAMTEALEAPSLKQAFGAPSPNLAVTFAIERLTEMRAAGKMSEEQYQRERKRLEEY